jgi:hypothetical protein
MSGSDDKDEIEEFKQIAIVLRKLLVADIIERTVNSDKSHTIQFKYPKKDVDELIETLPLPKYKVTKADKDGFCIVTAFDLEEYYYVYQGLNRDAPEFPAPLWEFICPGTEINQVGFVDLDTPENE